MKAAQEAAAERDNVLTERQVRAAQKTFEFTVMSLFHVSLHVYAILRLRKCALLKNNYNKGVEFA